MFKVDRMISRATKYAFVWVGNFYKWGGDDPSGFDCSGLVIEILKSVGILPRGGDYTAQALFDRWVDFKVKTPKKGCLAFWWSADGNKIVHVEYCINQEQTIGASGGGSSTTTIEKAIQQNAFIKVRPINYSRAGNIEFVNPFQGVKK